MIRNKLYIGKQLWEWSEKLPNGEKLNQEIIRLKENEGLSLQKICDELNSMKLYTPTKKKWDKPNLSSYYKTIKENTSKK